jgi:hypothetical protein
MTHPHGTEAGTPAGGTLARRLEWPLVALVALAALALGVSGFLRHPAYAAHHDLSGAFYLALQLFTLESGAVPNPVPWEMQIARLVAPGVALYAAVRAIAALFREETGRLRLRVWKDHVVVCGAGRKGQRIARGFRARGDRVVVIDRDAGASALGSCRAAGAVVLGGDATDERVLAEGRVHRARYVIAVTGSDGTNAEIAVVARHLAVARGGDRPVTCFAHVVDPRFCGLLREAEFAATPTDAFRLEFVNVFEIGARALVDAHPPRGRFTDHGLAHVVVVGVGRFGAGVVVHAARQWRDGAAPDGARMPIVVVDRAARAKVEDLLERHPPVARAADLRPVEMDVRSAAFDRGDFLRDGDGVYRVSVIYVCLDDESLAASVALSMLRQTRDLGVPVVTRLTDDAGLARLIGDGMRGPFAHLHGFAVLEQTSTPERLLAGTNELVARAIHEDYARRRGEAAGDDPAALPWGRLPESFRESNRRQADRLGHRLAAIGCGVHVSGAGEVEPFDFTAEEIEILARLEHERWLEERRNEGWRFAPGAKDVAARRSPALVEWTELTGEEREANRTAAKGLPEFLGRAGFGIHRLRTAPTTGDRRTAPRSSSARA